MVICGFGRAKPGPIAELPTRSGYRPATADSGEQPEKSSQRRRSRRSGPVPEMAVKTVGSAYVGSEPNTCHQQKYTGQGPFARSGSGNLGSGAPHRRLARFLFALVSAV